MESIPLIISGATALATGYMQSKNNPKLPTPEPVRPMPDPENPVAKEERLRKLATKGESRSDTILSDDTYGNTFLGQ
jgi:hypothetical protein